jgi:hypothetical protein
MAGVQGLFGTVIARNQRIVDFDSFILAHVPYGQVDGKKNIQFGLIEYDGPKADLGLVTKPLLAWHFGGIAYPITKAARIEYSYQYADGTSGQVKASILLGFQTGLAEQRLKPSPQIVQKQNDKLTDAAIARISSEQLPTELSFSAAAQTNTIVTGSAFGSDTLDKLIDTELLAELAAVEEARAKAGKLAASALEKCASADVAKTAARQARDLAAPFQGMADGDLTEEGKKFLNKEQELNEEADKASKAATKATVAANDQHDAIQTAKDNAKLAARAWDQQKREPVIMAFDGPARDNNSLNPFSYTPATLFNDRDKYLQLLWWYFGGKGYSVTKAIRVPIRTAQNPLRTGEDAESLFIGFAGPSGEGAG